MNFKKTTIPLSKLIIFIVFFALVSAEKDYGITWAMSGRVHSELKWHTIKTENFNVHYHKEIEEIAKIGANISEEVLPPLLKQLNMDDISRINIIFTAEDEVMNGFAMFNNSTFIWVDQNDAAIWLENGKWLEQVITHELQHIVYFNKVKTWLPEPYSLMKSKTPSWFVEGIAEYYTENWRPYRAEISHKYHVLKNSTSDMDSHHDGYSKIKLIAKTYGDSSIVKLLEHRTKFKLFDFEKAFKHATGTSVNEFNDLWRRVMNTYYYGLRAQKETYEDSGELTKLPISKLSSLTAGFKFSDDSLHIAMIGKENDNNRYSSLIIASLDTTKSKDKSEEEKTEGEKEESDSLKKKKSKKSYKKKEIDFGRIHPFLSWSNDGRYVAYSKYHYGAHGSMIWDIHIYDKETKKKKWATKNMRATYPIFYEDEIIFVAHKNSTSNLYKINFKENLEPIKLTNFTGNVQIVSPSISENKKILTFSMSKKDGNLDIYTFNIATQSITRKTFNDAVDYLPVFDDKNNIIFTSHRSGTPNLFKIDVNNKISQMTDVADGVWSIQRLPNDTLIIANTLNDVDSTRIIMINTNRTVIPSTPKLNNQFSMWKNHNPELSIDLSKINKHKYDYNNSIKKYSPLRHIKHQMSSIIPFGGILLNTNWTDALQRNIFSITGGSFTYNFKEVREDFPAEFFTFSYINALNGPLFGVNYYYNNNYTVRSYDNGELLERKDGMNLWVNFPYNAGDNLSSNHLLKMQYDNSKRITIMLHDTLSNGEVDSYGLPEPNGGSDNQLSINYRYLNRKPENSNKFLPTQGFGLELRAELGQRIDNLNYQRYSIDSFINKSFKGFIVYSRFKIEKVGGDPFPQDRVWFSQDNPLYISGERGTEIFGENLSPRGWMGEPDYGNLMVFHSIELRKALPFSVPIEFFGIKPGKITAALFRDTGQVDGNNWDQHPCCNSAIQTLGYEIKVPLMSSNTPIVFFSYGEAQPLHAWKNGKNPNIYFQMSLVNPF